MSTIVSVRKAQQGNDVRPIPGVMIEISSPFPNGLPPHEARTLHRHEAKKLADALFNSLPGGTLDRLIVEMAHRKVSDLRVRDLSLDSDA